MLVAVSAAAAAAVTVAAAAVPVVASVAGGGVDDGAASTAGFGSEAFDAGSRDALVEVTAVAGIPRAMSAAAIQVVSACREGEAIPVNVMESHG